MNFKFIIALACLVTSVTGFAAEKTPAASDSLTAAKVFAKIPLQVLDMIRPSSRLDMLDYYEHADSLLSVSDALGGQSRFETVTPDYLKVSVTPVSTLEIKLLPYKGNYIVMTLYTVGSRRDVSSARSNASNEQRATSNEIIAPDTQIQFFDENMNLLPTDKFLKTPSLKNFFNLKGSELKESELSELIPFESITYSIGPADTPLSATLTTLTTLPEESRSILAPLLLPPLTSPWKNRFKF